EAGSTDTQLTVVVPNDPVNLPAGIYTVTVIVSNPGQPDHSSNAVALGLAPQFTNKMPMTVKRAKNGDATGNITCAPEVQPEQKVALLLGSREVQPTPPAAQTNKLSFVIPGATPGSYFVRLRVDGTDSLLVNHAKQPPEFDATQKVTIQ